MRRITCTLLGAVRPDFVEGQPQNIFPCGKGNDEPERALAIVKGPDFQVAATQADQQVFNLVQGLHCGGWIIDGGRQRFDRNVHHQPDGVFGVLLERAFVAEFGQRPSSPVR